MIVKLGTNNRLINLLFNVEEALHKNDLSLLNRNILDKILRMSFGKEVPPYEIEILDDFANSQFFIVENTQIVKYIMFSYEQPKNTRNGYVMTKLPIPFRSFLSDNTTKKKSFEVCLLDVPKEIYDDRKSNCFPKKSYNLKDLNLDKLKSVDTINNYNIFTYKMLKTCNIRILNEAALPFDDAIKGSKGKKVNQYIEAAKNIKTPFASIKELIDYRLGVRKTNTGNKSSYIMRNNDQIVIFGKTFGNNGFESVMLACCVAELAKKEKVKVIFYQIRDNEKDKDAKPISENNLKLLKKLNIKVYDDLRDFEENPCLLEDSKEKSIRNQLTFMKNLFMKFCEPNEDAVKKCYLCGCTVPGTMIAAHIQRVCDINSDSSLTFAEKREKTTDADNGFWLCPNCDKWFEIGITTFDENSGKFVLGQDYLGGEKLSKEDVNYIINSTKRTEIDPKHFTAKTKKYLKAHNDVLRLRNRDRRSDKMAS